MAISDKTTVRLTIGLISAVLVTAVGGAWTFAARDTTERDHVKAIEGRTEALEAIARSNAQRADSFDRAILLHDQQIKSLMTDRFTLPMAAEVALRQAIESPGMRVVDPRDPSKVFVVPEGRRP